MCIKFVESSKHASNGEGWSVITDQKKFIGNVGIKVEKNGVSYRVISGEFRLTSLLKRIAVIALSIATLGIALLYGSNKSICLEGKEINYFAVPTSVLNHECIKKVKEDLQNNQNNINMKTGQINSQLQLAYHFVTSALVVLVFASTFSLNGSLCNIKAGIVVAPSWFFTGMAAYTGINLYEDVKQRQSMFAERDRLTANLNALTA